MQVLRSLGLAAALCATQPAMAADTAVEAPINRMVAAFNTGDIKAAKATHVASPSIIDEPDAPYVWSGPKAFDSWLAALTKSESAGGKTGGHVSVGAPLRESVAGNHAYVVVPSTYDFKQKGRAMRETGTMTFALVHEKKGWLIAGWTWSSPEAAVE